MNKNIRNSLLVLLFFVLSAFTVHKFYVGIYQLQYEPKKKEFQLTARIFIDDLEKALEAKHKKKIYLATPKEISETNSLIAAYLSDKMALQVNNSAIQLKFIAKETEDNVLICYLTAPVRGKIKTISVHNSVLTEVFPEQQNIIHINVNGHKKSLLLTETEPNGEVQF